MMKLILLIHTFVNIVFVSTFMHDSVQYSQPSCLIHILFQFLLVVLWIQSADALSGRGVDGNSNPRAVSGVIDHRQINIRSPREQDRH